MKKKTQIYGLGMLAVGLILALTLTGCPDGNNNGPPALTNITVAPAGPISLTVGGASQTLTATRVPGDATGTITWEAFPAADASRVSITPSANGLTAEIASVQPGQVGIRAVSGGIVSNVVQINVAGGGVTGITSWTLGGANTPDGWTAMPTIGTPSGAQANITDASFPNNMTLLGSHTTGIGWATGGQIQVAGLAAGQNYFLRITDVATPVAITVVYANTGGNPPRSPIIFINGEEAVRLPGVETTASLTHTFVYNGAGPVTVQIGQSAPLRYTAVVLSPPVPVTNVSVTGAGVANNAVTLAPSSNVQLTHAVIPAPTTTVLSSALVTWHSSDENAVSVSGTGLVTAAGNPGATANITARSLSNPEVESAPITVTIGGHAAVDSVEIIGASTVGTGNEITLNANVLPAYTPDRTVTWNVTPGTGNVTYTYDDTSITLTGTELGTVTVTATSVGLGADGQTIESEPHEVEVIYDSPVLFSWSAEDMEEPMAFAASVPGTINGVNVVRMGGSGIINNGGWPAGNIRWVLGTVAGSGSVSETTSTTSIPGVFDLSRQTVLYIDHVGATGGNFQVQVNNSTTGAGNSVHNTPNDSRVFNLNADNFPDNESEPGTLRLVIDTSGFTNGREHLSAATLTLRGESGFAGTITGIRLIRADD